MIETPYEGGCQCQSIRYRCSALPFVAYTCHCRACQRLTSSAFATYMQVPAEALELIKGSPSTGCVNPIQATRYERFLQHLRHSAIHR